MPSPQPIFELCNPTLAGITPDVFGVWTTVPFSAGAGLAFAAPAAPGADFPAEASVWRANFPSDPRLAVTSLRDAEAWVNASRQNIQTAPQRLEAFMQMPAGSPSFDRASQESLRTEPERELAALLQAIQAGAASVSFGLGDGCSGAWQQCQGTAERFRTFVDRVVMSVLHYAWVETCCEEQRLARTGVAWTGDTATLWRQGLPVEQIALHQRHLAFALASRNELARTFVLVIQMAVRLALLLSMPGNILQIIPAVWKFINQIGADT